MKPSKLYEALHALIGERVPLHIWGACGVGKSQIVSQVANDLDYDFLDVRAVQLDPVDLRGLPRIAADQTEWVPPKFLPTTGKGILFLDELTSAPQMTQTEPKPHNVDRGSRCEFGPRLRNLRRARRHADGSDPAESLNILHKPVAFDPFVNFGFLGAQFGQPRCESACIPEFDRSNLELIRALGPGQNDGKVIG
jgi:hypothetical protein